MSDLIVWLFFGVLIFAVLKYTWPVLLVAGIVWAIRHLTQTARAERKRLNEQDADLIARADRQHHAIICGDLVTGTYGDYLPPPGLR